MSAGMHQKLCILQARTYARISRHAQIIPVTVPPCKGRQQLSEFLHANYTHKKQVREAKGSDKQGQCCSLFCSQEKKLRN